MNNTREKTNSLGFTIIYLLLFLILQGLFARFAYGSAFWAVVLAFFYLLFLLVAWHLSSVGILFFALFRGLLKKKWRAILDNEKEMEKLVYRGSFVFLLFPFSLSLFLFLLDKFGYAISKPLKIFVLIALAWGIAGWFLARKGKIEPINIEYGDGSNNP